MKTINLIRTRTIRSLACLLAVMAIVSFTAFTAKAPVSYKVSAGSQIKVLGTSNLHDWDMIANNFTCEGNFNLRGDELQSINNLSFILPVTNLKSKENLLNTRAYKALNADKFKTITFKLTDAIVLSQQKIINATGSLTIAGVTKAITLKTSYVVNADESITCKGTETVKMSNHNVKAPSFMMGALKTGDAVTIDFVLKLKK